MPRKNISLHKTIDDLVPDLLRARKCHGLSNLIEVLIREEYERRHPPQLAHETAPPYTTKPPAPPATPIQSPDSTANPVAENQTDRDETGATKKLEQKPHAKAGRVSYKGGKSKRRAWPSASAADNA